MKQPKRLTKEMRQRQLRFRACMGGAVVVVGLVLILVLALGKKEEKDPKYIEPDTQIRSLAMVNREETETKVDTETENTEIDDWHYEAHVTDKSAGFAETVVSEKGILINVETGEIVAQKGAFDRISPASMTKILTVLVAAEHIKPEQLEDTFAMTAEISNYSYVNDCSNTGFEVGERITVKDLFYGTILPSGADAAVGLATYVAGSHEAFVELMNEKLEAMGLAETTHFTNCVGLYDEMHYSTPYDMAMILKAATDNVWCKEVMSAKRYTTGVTPEHAEGIPISNWFLRRIEDKDTHGEVLCAKTGYVSQSGSCAASLANDKNKKEYICVTAGSTSSWRCIYDHVDIYTQYLP